MFLFLVDDLNPIKAGRLPDGAVEATARCSAGDGREGAAAVGLDGLSNRNLVWRHGFDIRPSRNSNR